MNLSFGALLLGYGFHSSKCVSIISLSIQTLKGQEVNDTRVKAENFKFAELFLPRKVLVYYKLLGAISTKSEISTKSDSSPIS